MFRWEPFIVKGITETTCSFRSDNNDAYFAVCLFCALKRAKGGMRVTGEDQATAELHEASVHVKINVHVEGEVVCIWRVFQVANNEFITTTRQHAGWKLDCWHRCWTWYFSVNFLCSSTLVFSAISPGPLCDLRQVMFHIQTVTVDQLHQIEISQQMLTSLPKFDKCSLSPEDESCWI